MNNKVLVIGADHHNTIGIIESLGQKGIKSFVIILTHMGKSYVSKCKYVEQCWICDSNEKIIDCMVKNFNDEKNKAIVFSSADFISSLLDEKYSVLNNKFILPISQNVGHLSEYMNKQFMTGLAVEVGFDIPKTWLCQDRNIPADLKYPCMTKAISSLKGAKDNNYICKSRQDLENFLASGVAYSTLQIQEFINKEYEFQLLGCSLNGGEEILITGRTHIDRPKGIENTFFLKFDKCEPELEDTIQKALEFVRRTKYSGPFSIEFLRGKNGKNYFTEMNFRNDGNAYCQTAAGTNVPYIIYLYYTGGNYKKEIEKSLVKETYLMPEYLYFKCVLLNEVSIREFWVNLKRTTCYTTYFKDEKMMFFYFLYLELTGSLKNKLHKLSHKK